MFNFHKTFHSTSVLHTNLQEFCIFFSPQWCWVKLPCIYFLSECHVQYHSLWKIVPYNPDKNISSFKAVLILTLPCLEKNLVLIAKMSQLLTKVTIINLTQDSNQIWEKVLPMSENFQAVTNFLLGLTEDTGCSFEDLLEVMNDREKWRKRVKDIHASGTT